MTDAPELYPELPRLALSVRQPWVHGIFFLGKPVENRKWNTKMRGRICIHASSRIFLKEWSKGLVTYKDTGAGYDALKAFPAMADLPRGGIVGTVEIVDVVKSHPSAWFFGPYGFVLRDPQPVEFIPVKGALSFFDWRKNLPEVQS
ncbi:ASCH domain-containing protein [Agrobacterium vitis]|uniref:ASCH domain-containing protein n=1 Tax=Agrobacterium vitis TaxID=373 RepID=UPI0008724303|nr:ASCH domain-containing protein [Agrobacterium vitis]MCM2453384.1 ASCH domain-containing protein [Agrobacterium vitis]MCM2470935.1 ASCH domain-containing protein [Agrobacterium vitis]MUO70073.1 ASCH domain-containing protein [Agrobacterium vitis]